MPADFILCLNKQGKVRLSKWYNETSIEDQRFIIKSVYRVIQSTKQLSHSNIMEFGNNSKLIFKKYNGLYFIISISQNDNELFYLQSIPLFVNVLDIYFDTVSELDLIFNFYKMYRVLDEIFINGELLNINQKMILENLS